MFVVFFFLVACFRSDDTLPQLGIAVDGISVSGLSSGGYMAGQLHVAHSKQIIGAGIVAGGPFGCAGSQANGLMPTAANNLTLAFKDCINGEGLPDATALLGQAKKLANTGGIDPLADLSKDRIYLFSGGKDRIVARSVVEAARHFYIDTGVPQENVTLMTQVDAGHSFLTNDKGTACGASTRPYLSDCDYDQAGAILNWIYGDLNAPAKRATGKFLVFDQSPFAKGLGNGMSNKGVVYIPQACAHTQDCRLHIVLHGCRQNLDQVGMAFIEGSGFANWADTNHLVILFPQISASPVNPKACWDWWGYTGNDFLTKDALQIAAIWEMVQRLAERQ
jgi:poly(3-hydroxybutyrate) depolymerase